MKGISYSELISSHISYWKNFLQMLFNVSKTFSNYSTVLNSALNGKFPIDAILKSGKHVSLQTFNAMYVLAFTRNFKEVQCDTENDLVIISSKIDPSKKTILYGGINNGDIVYGFLKEDYGKLPINEKFVIDVGTNIGDTPIYFALNGAKKVIGLEPFPKNYELANKNITANNLSDKIIILLAGCAAKKGSITINPNYQSNHESKLIEFQDGQQIPLLTLEDLFNQCNIPSGAILKMDCEGCEDEIIMSASKEMLQKFSHMQIEYHSGYKALKEKLERCGFKVNISGPVATDVLHTYLQSFKKNHSAINKKDDSKIVDDAKNFHYKKIHRIGYTGFIYASRNI
ncbi:MAG TPA: FkbM family methyltransferase [Nitrosopumilaceae archaeon]|nr:FkbM family methyltransferase [Nitrosopumilaceae archaeon]